MRRESLPEARTRILGPADQAAALAHLSPYPFDNLILVDSVLKLGSRRHSSEPQPVIYGAFRGRELVGIASLRPSVSISAGVDEETVDALAPLLARVPSGLLKCDLAVAPRLWQVLADEGRSPVIDRVEVAYCLTPEQMVPASPALPGIARPARPDDLEDLVYAARASLWEEDRPDPAEGDPAGFRRWVEGRLGRARIVADPTASSTGGRAESGQMVFVAYADVQRPEGWLVQGVYTWPDARRQGFARRGMDSVIREAFAGGASHVQLAVVEGNERASALYSELGFEPFATLRTLLFH